MSEFSEVFKAAVVSWLNQSAKVGGEAQELICFEEETWQAGGCHTCETTEVTVDLTYRTAAGSVKTLTYEDNMAAFIRELTDE